MNRTPRPDVQMIIETVSAWDGITPAPHRFGGTEFTLGKVEVGHVHQHGLVDIPFPKRLRDPLVAAGDAQPHHLLADSGWISFYLRAPDAADQALRLYRLSYLQKRARRDRSLTPEALRAEVTALGFGAAVVAAFFGSEADAETAEE